MRGSRRFSQAISEGDGISVIAEISSAEAARRAEEDGAEALVLHGGNASVLPGVRAVTGLPVLLVLDSSRAEPLEGADACVVDAGARGDEEWLERVRREVEGRCELVVRIEDEDELAFVLEGLDPEVLVLGVGRAAGDDALERVLDLLPDVPAGKLVVAELTISGRDDVAELERAGVDAVIVAPDRVAELVGVAAPG